jgi:hypothetical protein
MQQLAEDLVRCLVEHAGTEGYGHDRIISRPSGPVAAHARPAGLGAVTALVAEVDQRIQVDVPNEIDAAAVTAITPIWPALGNVLLAPEAHAPITAIAGLSPNPCLVDEFHLECPSVV